MSASLNVGKRTIYGREMNVCKRDKIIQGHKNALSYHKKVFNSLELILN